MSDLREAIYKYLDETMLDINVDGMTDVLVDIVWRICVERERAAFVAGVYEESDNTKTLEMVRKTAARRYPLPKEE